MKVPAVAAAIRVIGEAIATSPVLVHRVLPGGEREPVPDHPAAKLLNGDWSPWLDSYTGILTITMDALLRDTGGLAWCNRVGGEVREIHRYAPGCISVAYDDAGEPTYTLATGTGSRQLDPADVIHVRPLGALNKCPVSLGREAIALAAAQERHAALLFKNSARPSGILAFKSRLSDAAFGRIKSSWNAAHSGEASGGTAIIEEGGEFKPLTFASTDLQFLELRKHQVEEIGRCFRVPPHLLFEMSRQTWSNSEQAGLEFISYTLSPWLKAWEVALRRAMFSPEERGQYVISFEPDDLSRADIGSRAQAYSSLISSRVLSPNEARRWEGLQPYPEGDRFENPAITPGTPEAPAAQEAQP